MPLCGPGNSTITGLGVFIPEQIVSTDEIVNRFNNQYGINSGYLKRVTGIQTKPRSNPSDLPSDLAVRAAKKALDQAKILPKDIDAIFYTGLIKDVEEPATAHIVQDKLGAINAVCTDLTNACHGFVNGLMTGDAFLAAYKEVKNVLVVTGEQGSRYEDMAIDVLNREPPDKELLKLFTAGLTLGDAGGAIVLNRKNNPDTGFVKYNVASFGEHYHLCVSGGPKQTGVLKTHMAKLMTVTSPIVADMFFSLLDNLRWERNSLATIVPHQTGLGMFKAYTELFGVPVERFTHTVEKYGNLITASLPVNLEKYSREATEGEKLILSIQGSGLAVSLTALIWPDLP